MSSTWPVVDWAMTLIWPIWDEIYDGSHDIYSNRQNKPVAHIPQCTSPISHTAPFWNRNVCTFLLKLMHCGIFVRVIEGFVRWINSEEVNIWSVVGGLTQIVYTHPGPPEHTDCNDILSVVVVCCPWWPDHSLRGIACDFPSCSVLSMLSRCWNLTNN